MENYDKSMFEDYELRGAYSTSFFQIYLNGDFNTDLSLMSQKDLGTFAHEYIHYLQNITTPFGLMYSEYCYSIFLNVKVHITNSKSITLPIQLPYNDVYSRSKARFNLGLGSLDKYNAIDRSNIKVSHSKVQIGTQIAPKNEIQIEVLGVGAKSITLGAFHIKEGMARLYQSFFDNTVKANGLDVPYNLVEIIANKLYPEIGKDTKKLICICFASLFSQYPGDSFLNLLGYASDHPDVNGLGILEYINSQEWIIENGKAYFNSEYMKLSISRFKKKLSSNLVAPMDTLDTVLNRVEVSSSNNYYPLLEAMYEVDFPNSEILNELIGVYGYTYVQANNGYFFPQTTKGEGEGEDERRNKSSDDILELIAQKAILTTLCSGKPCPLQYMCIENDWIDDNCDKSPWLHSECPYTVASEYLDLKSKIK